MATGRHRATRGRRGARALQVAAASALLAGGGLLPTVGTATADVPSTPATVTYALFQLPASGTWAGPINLSPITVTNGVPDVGQPNVDPLVYMPSINGGGESCVETADTGWICTPIVSDGALTANTSLTTNVEIFPAPVDAQLIDPVPDASAPEPPDVTTDDPLLQANIGNIGQIGPNPPDTGNGQPICAQYGYAIWRNPSKDTACPPLHWYKGYFYVSSHASSAWRVQNFASYWSNNVGGLTVGYGCPSSSHCVNVTDKKEGDTHWVGLTTSTWDAHNRYVMTKIEFNDSYRLTAAEHDQAVCHELGHAAGLGHEQRQAGCMSTPDNGFTTATSDDFNQLYYHTYAPGLPT